MNIRYLLKRLVLVALTVLCATFLTFVLLRLTPGDPAQLILQKVFVGTEEYTGSETERAAVVERYQLDRPLASQYWDWLSGAVKLDLGYSYTSGQGVGHELSLRLWPTMSLALSALGLSLVFTLLAGLAYNLSNRNIIKGGVDFLIITGIAIPGFYLALILVLVFSLWLDMLPVSGYGGFEHYILPTITLALTIFGYTTTILNDSAADIRSRPFILTARSKGLSPGTLFRRHILRNAMVPVAPYAALQLGYMLGGVVVVETVFSWPGIGKYLVDAIESKDVPVIQACVAVIAILFSLANLAADLVLWMLDPRVRYGEQ